MTVTNQMRDAMQSHVGPWGITGVAGFIGSHLLESLLRLDQTVVGLDNFSTGHEQNLKSVQQRVTTTQWGRFKFIEGDIRAFDACARLCSNAEIVLHQAALGSVPRSLKDPVLTNSVNIGGFLNMITAATKAGCDRFIYAASSSTYGDHQQLPKVEHKIGRPLSPYAVTKYANELYAEVFSRCTRTKTVGLRYFNVFGPRQDPCGEYSAVIPRWISAMISGVQVQINGDGETSRDFCYVDNVVLANLLAASTTEPAALNQIYNVAVGEQTTLNELYALLRQEVLGAHPDLVLPPPEYGIFRPGDVRHSLADIQKAKKLLHYKPTHSLREGLKETVTWFLASQSSIREN